MPTYLDSSRAADGPHTLRQYVQHAPDDGDSAPSHQAASDCRVDVTPAHVTNGLKYKRIGLVVLLSVCVKSG